MTGCFYCEHENGHKNILSACLVAAESPIFVACMPLVFYRSHRIVFGDRCVPPTSPSGWRLAPSCLRRSTHPTTTRSTRPASIRTVLLPGITVSTCVKLRRFTASPQTWPGFRLLHRVRYRQRRRKLGEFQHPTRLLGSYQCSLWRPDSELAFQNISRFSCTTVNKWRLLDHRLWC